MICCRITGSIFTIPRPRSAGFRTFEVGHRKWCLTKALACVGIEYFCFEGDGLWTLSDDALIDLAKQEIAIPGLVDSESVGGGGVVRQEKAYPVYDDDYLTNVAAVRAKLESRYPTLHLVGCNGMHRYNNQDHAMMTAILTVKNIMAGKRLCPCGAVCQQCPQGWMDQRGGSGDLAHHLHGRTAPCRLGFPDSRPSLALLSQGR